MFKDRSKKSKIGANGAKKKYYAYCECCDWFASKKYNWERHLLTKSHQKKAFKSVQNSFKNVQKGCKNEHDRLKKAAKKIYVCEYCNKEYKNRNGLWYHKKKCEYINEPEKEESESEEESEEEEAPSNDFVKMPKEVWEAFQHVIQNGTNNTTNNTNNTNCNNTYNNNITVQLYLGEHCKDAKSIEHIVDKLKNQLEFKLQDIVYKSNSQLIKDAPSDLFIKEIKKMPAEERPLHCADARRGKFWVKKDQEGWVKEDVNKEGDLKDTIRNFKCAMYSQGLSEIMDKYIDSEKPSTVKDEEMKSMLYHELMEKKTVDNAIIAKLATECNIKDAIKDIEKMD